MVANVTFLFHEMEYIERALFVESYGLDIA